jgi:hypothetical protein
MIPSERAFRCGLPQAVRGPGSHGETAVLFHGGGPSAIALLRVQAGRGLRGLTFCRRPALPPPTAGALAPSTLRRAANQRRWSDGLCWGTPHLEDWVRLASIARATLGRRSPAELRARAWPIVAKAMPLVGCDDRAAGDAPPAARADCPKAADQEVCEAFDGVAGESLGASQKGPAPV